MCKGFTLVELSIVLVIIGLLIGGILVGQSLIDSSKITAQVRQIQQFDIAVNNFIGKYKSLPGDSTKLDVAGNGDGILTDETASPDTYTTEILNFWNHLTTTELTNLYKHNNGNGIQSPGTGNGSVNPGYNCPKAKIGETATIIGMTSTGIILPNKMPFWHIRNQHQSHRHLFQGNEALGQSSPLTVGEAMSMDSKMDDGNAITGDVRASDGKRAGSSWAAGTTEAGCVVTTDYSKYDINKTTAGASDRPCALVIKMQIAK